MTPPKSARVKAKKPQKAAVSTQTNAEQDTPIVEDLSFENDFLPAHSPDASPGSSSDIVPSTVALKDRSLLTLYMQEMAKTPLLTPQEERELAIQVFEQQDKFAFQKLVQANLRFVVKIAFEYSRYGARVLDLIQEGNVGLLKAVHDFNPYKDVRLTTYAVWWIRSYIQDFLLRNWSLVRIGTTAAQKKLFYRLKKEQEKFEREGLAPEPKAIAMNLGVEESDVKLMQERMSGGDVSMTSPSRPGSDESMSSSFSNRVADTAALPSEVLEESEQKELFRQALEEFKDQLDERELLIFKDRLLSETPRTLLEIGEEYGFSKERARQLEERVKNKLKEFLAKHYPDISIT